MKLTQAMSWSLVLCMSAFAMPCHAALISTEDGSKTSWDTMDFTTMGASDPTTFTETLGSTDRTENWNRMQSFTAEHTGDVTSISILATRLWSGTYYMDVYESFDGDGTTYTSTPSKFRPWDANWLNPVLVDLELTVDSSNSINAGGVATVNLDLGEQFAMTAGATYAVGFRQANADPERLLWDYAESDLYAGGIWGYTGQAPVAGREFALAYNVNVTVPEPTSLTLLGLSSLVLLWHRRKLG